MNERLENFALNNNMQRHNDILFKDMDGYTISILEKDERIQMNISIVPESTQKTNKLLGDLFKLARLDNVVNVSVEDARVEAIFKNNDQAMEAVNELIPLIIEKLNEHQMRGLQVCPVCGQGFYESDFVKVNYDNTISNMHRECYEKLLEDKKVAEDRHSEGNYFSGTIGALIFGLIGTIPWIIVSLGGYFLSLLGYLIGVAANFGYNLFKGKDGKVKTLIIVVVIVVMVLFSQITTLIIESEGLESLSYGKKISYIIEYAKYDSQFSSGLIKNILLGLVFAFMGSLRLLSKSANKRKKQMADIELVA